MPVFNLHSISFTIEGAKEETSASIMEQAGRIFYDWIKKKEIRFRHFGEMAIPQEFPSLEQFLDRATYCFHGRNDQPGSLFASVSGELSDRRFVRGVRYKHEDPNHHGIVTAEALFVAVCDNTVICSSSLFFEGDRSPGYNTPPSYLLSLWQLGGRTYNTKSCSSRCRDIIQFGLSHVGETEEIRCIDHGVLLGFLADKKRKIIAVSIPERDFTESNPSVKSKIRTIAGRLVGYVEFFFLQGSYAHVWVHEPGRVFPSVKWDNLEKELLQKSQELGPAPLEDGAITVDDLSELLEPTYSTSSTESSSVSSPMRDPNSDDESGPQSNPDPMPSFAERLKTAITDLVAKLDSWNTTKENEP